MIILAVLIVLAVGVPLSMERQFQPEQSVLLSIEEEIASAFKRFYARLDTIRLRVLQGVTAISVGVFFYYIFKVLKALFKF